MSLELRQSRRWLVSCGHLASRALASGGSGGGPWQGVQSAPAPDSQGLCAAMAAATAAAPAAASGGAAEPAPKQTLYLNNLNEKVKRGELKKTLYATFSQFGRIMQIICKGSFRLKGQAWIIFDEVTAAAAARRQLHNCPILGKPMVSRRGRDPDCRPCLARRVGTGERPLGLSRRPCCALVSLPSSSLPPRCAPSVKIAACYVRQGEEHHCSHAGECSRLPRNEASARRRGRRRRRACRLAPGAQPRGGRGGCWVKQQRDPGSERGARVAGPGRLGRPLRRLPGLPGRATAPGQQGNGLCGLCCSHRCRWRKAGDGRA